MDIRAVCIDWGIDRGRRRVYFFLQPLFPRMQAMFGRIRWSDRRILWNVQPADCVFRPAMQRSASPVPFLDDECHNSAANSSSPPRRRPSESLPKSSPPSENCVDAAALSSPPLYGPPLRGTSTNCIWSAPKDRIAATSQIDSRRERYHLRRCSARCLEELPPAPYDPRPRTEPPRHLRLISGPAAHQHATLSLWEGAAPSVLASSTVSTWFCPYPALPLHDPEFVIKRQFPCNGRNEHSYYCF
jgi:hypothetical protein